jgi:hypothetical protein
MSQFSVTIVTIRGVTAPKIRWKMKKFDEKLAKKSTPAVHILKIS